MSADLMRWMFCRHNPAHNINFGYRPAEEVRSKFVMKLWNTYAFFCNYARLDGFDPNTPQVPVSERPNLDRWILSDLQLLIQTAQRELERYNVQAFCLAAEEFVDDKLSNWYVRRNRRRFWKSEQSADKLAAYQTLYTVLTALTRLFAPIMPFLTEAMHRNLMASEERPSEDVSSIHLERFPEVDESLIDADLSADMEALLRLVSLGSAARNSVKIKVRQPLGEMKVQPADERDLRAIQRFADQICEELNLKKVMVHTSDNGSLLHREVRPNMKNLGPKFGARLKEVQAALTALTGAAAETLQAGQPVELACPGGPVTLEPADVSVHWRAPEGWAGVEDRGTQVALDVTITEPLALEGMARDIVRQVQDLRKASGLEMEDRIVLYLGTEAPRLRRAIQAHRAYITDETLAVEVAARPLGADAPHKQVTVDGQPLVIELQKATNS
jgi:isoleucyl-tRNA synthetase